MSQVRTVTLRTDDNTLDLDKVVADLVVSNPGLTVNAWKKKGKHKKKVVEAEAVSA